MSYLQVLAHGMPYVCPCCVAATGVEGSVLRSKQEK
jgi:hypothetical protein